MQVKEIMQQPVLTVNEETTLAETAQLMLAHKIGCVPVVNAQGKLSGIITESDFVAKEKGVPFSTFHAPQVLGQWLGEQNLENIYRAARARKAKEIMSPLTVTVGEEEPIEAVIKLMLQHDINRIPVVRDNVPVGMVARHDFLQLMLIQLMLIGKDNR